MVDDVLDQPNQLEDALWRFELRRGRRAMERRVAACVVCGMGGSAVGRRPRRAAIVGPGLSRRPPGRSRLQPPRAGRSRARWCSARATRARPRRRSRASRRRARRAPRAWSSPPAVRSPRRPARMACRWSACRPGCSRAPRSPTPRSPRSRRRSLRRGGALALGRGRGGRCAARGARPGSGVRTAPEDGAAKRLARALRGPCPSCSGPGRRCRSRGAGRTSSTRTPSSSPSRPELPEADHNEVCGWELSAGPCRSPPFLLEAGRSHPRVLRRMGLTAEVVGPGRSRARARARGLGRTAWSACSPWSCSATSSPATWPCWMGSTRPRRPPSEPSSGRLGQP